MGATATHVERATLGVVDGDDIRRGTIPWAPISLPMKRELPVKPRLLIVEDEVMIRIFMRDVFEGAGFKTREAANADEALELLKAEEFAAILSDIEMPGSMTGVDLAWVVNSKWPRTGLVLVSGRRLPSLMRMPTKAKFIAKPCQVDLLLQTVSEVLLP